VFFEISKGNYGDLRGNMIPFRPLKQGGEKKMMVPTG
jgi:hypothetical protein